MTEQIPTSLAGRPTLPQQIDETQSTLRYLTCMLAVAVCWPVYRAYMWVRDL